MKRQQPGDSIGELDEDGIAVWYPNCKVRFDGSNYIATPHTTNRARRRKHREQVIAVSIEDGKLSLEPPSRGEEKPPSTPKQMTVEEVAEAHENSPPESTDEPKRIIRHTTRKQIFDELYEKYLYLKPRERKQAILNDMRPLFENEDALKVFVDDNCLRRWRNLVVRRQRFARKAYNQHRKRKIHRDLPSWR